MRPTISEFSYGFALTSELVQAPGGVVAAPVFPSLIAEGQQGGGWDVRLDRPGVPLFLQFKLCDFMARRSCREVRQAGFNLPCYRMHLRSARISKQHEMLLDLEALGEEVYYSAPAFHQPDELNAAFLAQAVRSRSIWVKPSDIGPLPDQKEHHLSFERGGPWTLFSEPKRLEKSRGFSDVIEGLSTKLKEKRAANAAETYEELANSIVRIAEKRHDIDDRQKAEAVDVVGRVSPLSRIAYYASVFLESQFFIAQERDSV